MAAEIGFLPDIEEAHEEDRVSQLDFATTPSQAGQSGFSGLAEVEPPAADDSLHDVNTISEEMADIDYDTDIEIDEEQLWETNKEEEDYNVGTVQYKRSCSRLKIPAEVKVVENLANTTLNLEHQGLGEDGAKALAKSLLKNTKVEKLKLDDNSITPLGVTFLCDMLCDNIYINYLDLSNNDVSTHGCLALQEMLMWNTTLSHLILSGCQIKDSDVAALSEGIQRNECVVYLDLSHNKICEDGAMLFGNAIALNNGIEALNISWNHIRRRGAVQIMKGLKRNYCMQKVDISWNGLGFEGALSLGQMLKTNKYVRELDVSSNRLTWNCVSAIAVGLKDNDTLEVLKIGHNALTMTGVLELMHAVSNDRSELEYLGFEGIPISRKIAYMAERLGRDREFTISHGGVIDTEDVLGRKPVPQDDPLTRLLSFLEDRSIRAVDLFRSLEKDKDNLVTREQFIAGLKKALVPLETWEMMRVMEVLDKNEEGKINYRKLNLGIKEKKVNNKKKDNQMKLDEKRKHREERRLLNPEQTSSRANSIRALTSTSNSLRSSTLDLNVTSRRASRISLNLSQSMNDTRRPSSVSGLSLPASTRRPSNYLSSHRSSMISSPNSVLANHVTKVRRESRDSEVMNKLQRLSVNSNLRI